ncbi:chaperonin 10-like protein [Morchella snyderi]|nr:chaperonin 10-like protein [Morchella snyderi]
MAATIPTSSLALTFTTPSSTPQVTPSPLPSPLPPTSLLVRVHAAALNPCDTQMLHWPLLRLLKGAGPKGLGRDYSGTVVAVGGDCKDWRVGDEVFGLFFKVGGEGTIREYLVVDPATDPVVAKPASVSHEQAASIPLVALTAFTCLEWLPPPHEDGTPREVVVVGASGGTGVWVTQFTDTGTGAGSDSGAGTHADPDADADTGAGADAVAKKHYNCNVTAICSGKNASFVASLGADRTIDYTLEPSLADALLSRRPKAGHYDLIVDCVGGTALFPAYTQLLPRHGAYVTIVGDKTSRAVMGGPPTYVAHPAMVWRHVWGWVVGPRYGCVILDARREWLEVARELVVGGKVKVEVQETVEGALEGGWRKGFELLDSGRVRGKVVVKI